MKARKPAILAVTLMLAVATQACQPAASTGPDVTVGGDQPAAQPTIAPATVTAPAPTPPPQLPIFEQDAETVMRMYQAGPVTALWTLINEPAQEASFVPHVESYTVDMASDSVVDIGPGTCVATAEAREQVKSHWSGSVTVDGYELQAHDMHFAEWKNPGGLFCFALDTVTSNWPVGVHHVVTVTTYDADVNNGWNDLAAGDYVTEYTITVTQ